MAWLGSPQIFFTYDCLMFSRADIRFVYVRDSCMKLPPTIYAVLHGFSA